jgi:hypothetical protein
VTRQHFALGVVVPKGAPKSGFNLAINVDQEEYDSISEALARLRRFSDQDTFELVRHNFEELVQTVDDVRQVLERSASNLAPARQSHRRIQTCLVNWLQSTRVFLDQTSARLRRDFGADSNAVQEFETATHSEYDAHLTYRLVYKLRDYCTHIGMPPLSMSYGASIRRQSDGSEEEVKKFKCQFDPRSLLDSWDDWRAQVTADLQGLQGPFDVVPAVTDAMEAFRRLAILAMAWEFTRASDAADLVLRSADRVSDLDGVPCVFKASITPSGEVATISPVPLDIDLARAVASWNRSSA